MRLGAVLTLVAAIVFGGFAAFLAKAWLDGQANASIPPTPPTGTIVVATESLPFGTVLTEENTTEIPWQAGALPHGAFPTKTALLKDGRRVVLNPLEKHEPVLEWKVTGAGQRASLSALIHDENMRAVTVRVDDVRGVAGFVLPGDRVDVVLIQGDQHGSPQSAPPMSDILLQNVRVLGVDQLANEKQDKPTLARAATLEVNTEQAQKLILAGDVGKLSLILRQAGSAQVAEHRRITKADLGPAEPPPPPAPVKAEPQKIVVAPPPPPPAPPIASISVVRGVERSTYSVLKEQR